MQNGAIIISNSIKMMRFNMNQVAFTVRMDNSLKNKFEEMCENFGMSMSTAINVFARAVIKQKKIPFDIAYDTNVDLIRAKTIAKELREDAKKNGTTDMSLEEINKEIYG